MRKLCNNCKYRKKLEFSTLFKCEKYGVILTGQPPQKCEECLNDNQAVKKNREKKEFIEVK